MTNLRVLISSNYNYNQGKIANYFDNVLTLEFKSEEDYLKFSENPYLTIDNFNIIDCITDIKEIEKILKKENIPRIFKKSPVIVEITNFNDLPIKLLNKGKKIKFKLLNMNYTEIIKVLTSPYVHENVSFYDKFNEGMEISLKDMIKVYEKLLTFAKVPLENKYSPAESFYYIYNVLKKRIYKEEDKKDEESKSRGLKEVLNGDKIVCVGYSNLFAAICSVLDLPVEICSWVPTDNSESGHVSNIVYLNDPKYNLFGIYAIDTTWDSKQNEYDTEYENDISHFLIPLDIEEKEKKIKNLKPGHGCNYYRFFISKKHYNQIPAIRENKKIAYKKAYNIFKSLNIKENVYNIDLDTLEETIKKLGNKKISTRQLRNIIAKVTPKNDDDLNKTIKTSIYNKIEAKQTELLLKKIFG